MYHVEHHRRKLFCREHGRYYVFHLHKQVLQVHEQNQFALRAMLFHRLEHRAQESAICHNYG